MPGYGRRVSALQNRSGSVLLVVDVQNAVVAQAYRRDAVIGNIAALVQRARGSGVAVVWVQHSDDELPYGGDGWQIVPELVPTDGESRIEKVYGDAFEDTSLDAVLAELGVGRLVVVGAQTDACIRSTIHGAFTRGFDVTLVSDAHTTEDQTSWGAPAPEQVIAHTNLYWSYQRAPGRSADVVATADIEFTPG